MKKSSAVILDCVLIAAGTAGCERFLGPKVVGSGISTTQTRTVDGVYSALDIAGGLTVEAVVGESTSLEITGDDNIVPLIQTIVRDSRLMIELKERVKPVTPIKIVARLSSVSRISCAGAVTLRMDGITGEKLEFETAGAGSATLRGQVMELSIDSAGAGDIDAAGLLAKRVSVDIAGAGNVTTHAEESLKVSITGAGNVSYSGEPKIEQTVTGFGKVKRKE